MKTALLVIDIQKDYFPEGKFPLVEPLAAAQKAYMLLQCFREHGGRHVHIQHISLKPDATFFIKGDSGSDIHDAVTHFEGEPIVYKHYPNSFRETNLLEILREWGVERVVISGMMTHMCVDRAPFAAVVGGGVDRLQRPAHRRPPVARAEERHRQAAPGRRAGDRWPACRAARRRSGTRPRPSTWGRTRSPPRAPGRRWCASGSIGIRACAGGGGPPAATSPAGPAPAPRRGSGRRR